MIFYRFHDPRYEKLQNFASSQKEQAQKNLVSTYMPGGDLNEVTGEGYAGCIVC